MRYIVCILASKNNVNDNSIESWKYTNKNDSIQNEEERRTKGPENPDGTNRKKKKAKWYTETHTE